MRSILKLIAKNLHFIIIAFVVYGIYEKYEEFQLQIASKKNEIKTLEKKIKSQKIKIQDLKQFEQDLESSKIRIDEVRKNILTVQKQLPNSISDTEILETLNQEANFVNLKKVFLNPKGETLSEEKFYFKKEYSLKGKGTYLQFLIFFERLLSLERILNINKLQIKSLEKSKKSRFQIIEVEVSLEAYRFNSGYEKTQGIEDIQNVISTRKKK